MDRLLTVLTFSLVAATFIWTTDRLVKAEKQASYLQGQMDIWQSFAGEAGTVYTKPPKGKERWK